MCLGREGEEAAAITRNNIRIESITGTAKYRIPDELLDNPKILREIKNVKKLSYTNQIRDFNLWAQQNGYSFILQVRKGAKLTAPLEQAIKNGQIILKEIP